MVICKNCGAENPDEADMCEVCDARIRKPLRLFKRKERSEPAPAERRPPEKISPAKIVRDIEVQGLSPEEVSETVAQLVQMLQEEGIPVDDVSETRSLGEEAADLIEAVDSKVMELEMELKRPLDSPSIYHLLGNGYLVMEELSRAERFYEKAASRDRGYINSLFRVARRYLVRGEREQALASLERALAIDPNDPQALYFKAKVMKEMGNLRDALAFVTASLKGDNQNESAWMLRAEIYELLGDVQKSLDSLNTGISLMPTSQRLLWKKGDLLVSMGRGSEAISMIDSALASHRDSAPLLALKGRILMANAAYDDAERTFDMALEKDEECVAALVGMGTLMAMRGEYGPAHEFLDVALEIEPDEADALTAKSLVHAREGDVKKALTVIDGAIARHPEDVGVWRTKGDLLSSRGLHNEAVEIYQKALQISPSNVAVMHSLAVAYTHLKMYDEALATFKRCIETSKGYAPAYLDFGMMLLEMGKGEEAIRVFERYAELRPTDTEGIHRISVSLKEKGHEPEAMDFFRRLGRGEDVPLDVLRAQYEIASSQGAWEECIDILRQMEKRERTAELLLEMGKSHLNLNDLTNAISSLEESLEMEDSSPEAWYTLGLCYFKEGSYNEALEAVDEAISLKPGYMDAYTLGVQVGRQLGKMEKVLEYGEHALQFQPDNSYFHECVGDAHSALDRPEDALREYLSASRQSGDSAILLKAGRLAYELGKYDEAESVFSRARDATSGNPEVQKYYGLLLWRRGDANAESYIRSALKAMRRDGELWNAMGHILLEKGEVDTALQAFDRAVNEGYGGALLGKADALTRAGKENEAADVLSRAMKEGLADVDSILRYAELRVDAGAHADALKALNGLPEALPLEVRRTAAFLEARCHEAAGERERALEVYSSLKGDPRALYRIASIYAGEREFEKALKTLEALLRQDPAHTEGLKLRVRVLEALGEDRAVLQTCERISSFAPEDVDVLRKRVEVLRRLNRVEETLPLYERILQLVPGDAAVRAERMEVLRSLGRLDTLVEEYRSILKSDPEDMDALLGLGETYALLKDAKRSMACFDRVLSRDSRSVRAILGKARLLASAGETKRAEMLLADEEVFSTPEALVQKGDILAEMGMDSQALQAYARSAKLGPEPEVYVKIAGILLRMGEYTKAEDMCTRALAKDEKVKGAKRARGLARLHQGKKEEAFADLKAECEGSPDAVAYMDLGSLALEMGREGEALSAYNAVTRLEPENVKGWLAKSGIYLSLGKRSFALECARRALNLRPGDLEALRTLCRVHLAGGEWRSVVKYAGEVVSSGKADPEIWRMKAEAHERLGEHAEAITAVKEALKADREDPGSLALLGRVLLHMDRVEEGVRVLWSVLKKDPGQVEAVRELASHYISCGEMSNAERVLSSAGEEREVQMLRAEMYEKARRPNDAISVYMKVLSSGEDLEVLKRVVSLLLASGRADEVVEYADRALRLAPGDARILRAKGEAYLELERYGEAFRAFDRAYRQTNEPSAGLGMAIALYHLGRYEEAKDALHSLMGRVSEPESRKAQIYLSRVHRALGEVERALKVIGPLRSAYPGDRELLKEYVESLDLLGRFDEIITAYSEWLEKDQLNIDAWRELVRYLGLTGRHRQAAETAMRMVSLDPKDRSAYITACREFASAGDLTDALRVSDEALHVFGSDPEIWVLKGDTLLEAGRVDDALECFEHARGIDPKNWDAHLKLGRSYLMKGDLQASVDALDEAVAIDSSRSPAWCALGTVLFCAGRDAEAKLCYEHAISLDPGDDGAYLGLAEVDIVQGRIDDALTRLRNVRAKSGARYHYDHALTHIHRKEYPQALAEVNRGLGGCETDPSLHRLKGHILLMMGKYEDALDAVNRSLSLDRSDESLLLRGLILGRMGDHSEALSDLASIPSDSPLRGRTEHLRGSVLQMVHEARAWSDLGMDESEVVRAALESLEKAVSHGSRSEHHTALGYGYLRAGDMERALASFNRSIELQESASAWRGKAEVYIHLEMYPDAVRAANRSLSQSPDDALTWFIKGCAELRMEDMENARVSFERCLSVRDEPAVWRAMAFTLFQQGKTQEALTCLDKVIIHHPRSPEAFVEKGVVLLEARVFRDAIRSFDSALRLDRSCIPAWNGRGVALMYLGRTKEAVKCFREMERLGEVATSKFNSGVAHALAEDYTTALREFEDVLRLGRDEEAEVNRHHAMTELRRRGYA